MTLTRADLVEAIVRHVGLEREDAVNLLNQIFIEIGDCLSEQEPVKISGFGRFEVREKKARPGRNPKTGEAVQVSARRSISFKAGQKLKSRVEFSKPRSRWNKK